LLCPGFTKKSWVPIQAVLSISIAYAHSARRNSTLIPVSRALERRERLMF
jgi:hypothetical protein